MEYTKLGRIRPVYSGEWSSARAYTTLEMVRSADGSLSYIAGKDVPAGTSLSNGEYWAVVLDVSEVLAAAEKATDKVNGAVNTKASALQSVISGNPVQFTPDAESTLRPILKFGPFRSGSGDPSPDNIRRLGGRSTISLVHNGSEYVVNLGQPVVAGTLDWNKGEVSAVDYIRELDGSEGWNKASSTPNTFYVDYYNNGGSAGSPALLGEICSHYKTAENTNHGSVDAYYPLTYSWNIYRHMFTDSRFNDLAAWRAYLAEQKAAGTPVQVTESLVRTDSTVFVLQSLPSLITAQEGVNTVSGDADEIEIGYNKSLTVAYEELKNAILAMGGNV